jgi:hypothetical protein
MSSNYSYKDIPLNQIYDSSGISTANQTYQGYIGFPLPKSTTNFSYLRPIPFGYSGPSGDLYNLATARNTGIIIDTSLNCRIPTGCKSINVIAVGGGGGGGGGGGKASATSWDGNFSSAFGGKGGAGGYGKYGVVLNRAVLATDVINITIGVGGDRGLAGDGDSAKTNATGQSNSTNNGKNGDNGTTGGTTIITINSTNSTNTILEVAGGNLGFGGTRANARADNGANSRPGEPGANGTPISTTYGGMPNAYPNLSTFGNPGNGGIDSDSSVAATPGTRGAVQIIWLYD